MKKTKTEPDSNEPVSIEEKMKRRQRKTEIVGEKTEKQKIGERLGMLRADLSKRKEMFISQKQVSEELGLHPSMVERMENNLGGQLKHFHKIYEYYHNHGYNIYWIIAENNQHVPMYRPVKTDESIELSGVIFQSELFKEEMNQIVKSHIERFQAQLTLNS